MKIANNNLKWWENKKFTHKIGINHSREGMILKDKEQLMWHMEFTLSYDHDNNQEMHFAGMSRGSVSLWMPVNVWY